MRRRRWIPSIFLVGILLLCSLMASHIDYQEDIAAFMPISETTRQYMDIYSEMGHQDRVAILFHGNTDEAAEAMDAFEAIAQDADTAGLMLDLQMSVDESAADKMFEGIYAHYPQLLTKADIMQLDTMLSTEGFVQERLAHDYEILMLPTATVTSRFVPYDPLGICAPITQSLQRLNKSSFATIDGHLFAPGDTCGIGYVTTTFGATDTDRGAALISLLEACADSTMATVPDVRISLIGAAPIALANASQIKHDSMIAVALSAVLILLVLLYAFRRPDDLAWILLSVAFGWLFALGVIALLKASISVIVLGIGSIIIGVAVNYPLHFLDHLKHEPDRRRAVKEMVPPLLIGNITTVSAFACLYFLDAEAMRDLGLFGSLMLVGTIFFVLVLLPHFVRQRRVDAAHSSPTPLNSAPPTPRRPRRWALAVVVLLTAVMGYYSLGTTFDADMQHINFMTPEQREDMARITSAADADSMHQTLFAVSSGATLAEALQHHEALAHSVAKAIGNAHCEISSYLPTESEYNSRKQAWKELWQKHSAALNTLKNEAPRQGFSADAFAPFLAMTDCDVEDDMGYEQFLAEMEEAMSPIASQFILRPAEDSLTYVVELLQTETARSADVKDVIRGTLHDANAFVFDSADVNNVLTRALVDSFNYIGFVCAFVVFAFLWLSFGRIELSMLSFVPLAVAWIWILGMMGIFGIQFNIVNIILATFIFGQGDDYTIFITEGMIYEYAYGRRRLDNYKRSVALSALLMFIGIGTLIIARHPAMRSLAEVTIIGMAAVVIMAFYFPPLIFRWLTTSKGVVREVPWTLRRFVGSLIAIGFLLVCSVLIFVPVTLVMKLLRLRCEKALFCYHKLIQWFSYISIHNVPDVKYRVCNTHGEDFSRPALIISNHQSHLDVMCLLALTPKVVILTKDWVWSNPIYGYVVRMAEYYPISYGIDDLLPRLRHLIDRGYSVVVFPEGTRTKTGRVGRFHKGAFLLAQELGVDILPINIHGLSCVNPRRDLLLRKGSVTVDIGERQLAAEQATYKPRELTRYWHRRYVEKEHEMIVAYENVDYFTSFIKHKYMYKGLDIERLCARNLKAMKGQDTYIRSLEGPVVHLQNSGQGEYAWMLALIRPDLQIWAFEADEETYAVAAHTQGIPANLHFVHLDRSEDIEDSVAPRPDLTIDVAQILK